MISQNLDISYGLLPQGGKLFVSSNQGYGAYTSTLPTNATVVSNSNPTHTQGILSMLKLNLSES